MNTAIRVGIAADPPAASRSAATGGARLPRRGARALAGDPRGRGGRLRPHAPTAASPPSSATSGPAPRDPTTCTATCIFRNDDRAATLPIELRRAARRRGCCGRRSARRASTRAPAATCSRSRTTRTSAAGLMFAPVDADGSRSRTPDAARLRAALEPVVEVMQHKGDSECLPRRGHRRRAVRLREARDEHTSAASYVRLPGRAARAAASFVRDALARGARAGGAARREPVQVRHRRQHRHAPRRARRGRRERRATRATAARARPRATVRCPRVFPTTSRFNPGGLAVIWAEENSRDALFAALRRREVYGTSGPRHVVRFFGGFGSRRISATSRSFVARGYANGVPMGGDLPAPRRGSRAALRRLGAARSRHRDRGRARRSSASRS